MHGARTASQLEELDAGGVSSVLSRAVAQSAAFTVLLSITQPLRYGQFSPAGIVKRVIGNQPLP